MCKLVRTLYGLKQVRCQWNKESTSKLLKFGFTQSTYDNCLFTNGQGSYFIALLVYVNDVLLTKEDTTEINVVKDYLHHAFIIKDIGEARYFLGVEIIRIENALFVTTQIHSRHPLRCNHVRS